MPPLRMECARIVDEEVATGMTTRSAHISPAPGRRCDRGIAQMRDHRVLDVELTEDLRPQGVSCSASCQAPCQPSPDARKVRRFDQMEQGDLSPVRDTSCRPCWRLMHFTKERLGYHVVNAGLAAGMLEMRKDEDDAAEETLELFPTQKSYFMNCTTSSWKYGVLSLVIMGVLAAGGGLLYLVRTPSSLSAASLVRHTMPHAQRMPQSERSDCRFRYPSYHRGWFSTDSFACAPGGSWYGRLFSTTTTTTTATATSTQTRTETTSVTLTATFTSTKTTTWTRTATATATTTRTTTKGKISTTASATPSPEAHAHQKRKPGVEANSDDLGHDYFRDHSLLDAAGTTELSTTTAPLRTTTTQPSVRHSKVNETTGMSRCLGTMDIAGHGDASLVHAVWNIPGEKAGGVELSENILTPHLKGRGYFTESCSKGDVVHSNKYSAFRLLGHRLKYTVDVSNAGCGCNAALYLVSMRQNPNPSQCFDHYCDAASVCGVSCAEVDLQEANRHAWHSTLHKPDDLPGLIAGYGGGDSSWNGPRDWDDDKYAPHAKACINTLLPFYVAVAFPTDASGNLISMQVGLSQSKKGGSSCEIGLNITSYAGMPEVTRALSAGMTLVVSYWRSDNMLWLDGRGADSMGPCAKDDGQCGQGAKFFNFSIEKLV